MHLGKPDRRETVAPSLGIKMSAIGMSLCLCALVSETATAFVHPLGEEQVREAYFLGRSTDAAKVANFLGQYVRRFPIPAKGPHVAEIEFRTPYEQVVLRSWQNSMGYSAQQARQDYSARPDLLVIRVLIYFTPTYGLNAAPTDSKGQAVGRSADFWREFQFRVAQENDIEPRKMSARSIYRRGGGLGGAEVFLEFSASQFVSRTARVSVTTPSGLTVVTEFDLDHLQ